jgi:hypothetical protein
MRMNIVPTDGSFWYGVNTTLPFYFFRLSLKTLQNEQT